MCGILCSIVGTFFVKTEENASQKSLLRSLRTGTYLAAVLSALAAAPLTYFMVGNWGVYAAILCGLIGGCAIGYFTEYYTSDTYKPTQKLAAARGDGLGHRHHRGAVPGHAVHHRLHSHRGRRHPHQLLRRRRRGLL